MTARQIAKYFGSVTAAAKRAGIARETLHRWHRSGVPSEWQVWFEVISNGVLKATKESK